MPNKGKKLDKIKKEVASVKKPRIDYKKKFLAQEKQNAILQKKNISLIIDNEKSLKAFQEKAKGFQTKAQAEIDKFKKNQSAKNIAQKEHLIKYGATDLLLATLTPLLNMEFAIITARSQKNGDVKSYVDGFAMLMGQVWDALADHGVSKIVPKVGDLFNPELHNTLETLIAKKTPKIGEVKQPGFMLYDRVVKTALVVLRK